MVNLIPQSEIDAMNIDTVERAIVFGTLALQIAISQVPDNLELRQKVKLTIKSKGKSDVYIGVDVTLPLNLYSFGKYGGDLLNSIDFFNVGSVSLTSKDFGLNSIAPSQSSPPTMPVVRGLGHFERYLYYYASVLWVSLSSNRNEVISIAPKLDGIDNSELRIKADLPIDPQATGQNFNLINSISAVTTNYVYPSTTNSPAVVTTPLNNNVILTNNTLLTNNL